MSERIVWTDSVPLDPDHGLRSCRACGRIMIGSDNIQSISAVNAQEAVRKKKKTAIIILCAPRQLHFVRSQAAGGAQDDEKIVSAEALHVVRSY
jgi:hypothetical protein